MIGKVSFGYKNIQPNLVQKQENKQEVSFNNSKKVALANFSSMGSLRASVLYNLSFTGNPSYEIQEFNGVRGGKIVKIDDNIYRGGTPIIYDENGSIVSNAIPKLKEKGIKTVISMMHPDYDQPKSTEIEEKLCQKEGINFHFIELDEEKEPSSEKISKIMGILRNKENHPVYFHCFNGRDRVGLVTALYRTQLQGGNASDAVAEIKELGYNEEKFPALRDYVLKNS
jgi:protein tyrosine/serine phosphatase